MALAAHTHAHSERVNGKKSSEETTRSLRTHLYVRRMAANFVCPRNRIRSQIGSEGSHTHKKHEN